MLKNILDKKILCPFSECNNDIKVKLSEDHAQCDKCKKTFFYIQCYYCVQLIFFKEKTNTNGFNIRCPYKGCGMVICRVQCPQCNKFLVHRDTYYQGEVSSCSDCEKSFTVLTCPFKACGKTLHLEPTYILGSILPCYHAGETKCFQKISCMCCYRHIYFDNNLKINDKNNSYIPTQLVRCPYENCKAETQQVECDRCSWRWFVVGHKWSFGRLITCKNDNCNNEFSYSMCPECLEVQTHPKCCLECQLIRCIKCDNEYQFTNCRKCHEVIFWSKKKNKEYQHLQLIKCPTCETLFQTIKCSECNHLSTFFANSMTLSVPHCCKSCNKKKLTTYWSMYFCSECGIFNMKKVKASSSSNNKNQLIVEIEGDNSCSKCHKNNTFVNTQCPHCLYVHTVISTKKAKTKAMSYMSKVQCQNQICKKYFYYYKCTCGLDYTRENMQNPFKCAVCSESIYEYYCPICKRKSINIQNKCDRCHNPKTILSTEPNEEIKLKFVEFQQGDPHSFGKPEKDYGEVQISENLIQTGLYFNKPNQLLYENETHIANIVGSLSFSCEKTRYSSKKIDSTFETKEKCVICYAKDKQSVFAPCGHRCVCFECGKEYIKNKNKVEAPKCPLCKEIIFDFLEKVDDSEIVF